MKTLPHGRYDNPVDPSLVEKLTKLSKRQRHKKKKRWFCRYFMFKHDCDTWGLENVEDMTAEQYTEALEGVHQHLSTNQHHRKAWKLEHDQGPNDVTERDTEQAWYSGTPTRYKNFSYRVLTYFVNDLQHGATPLTCSERVFEEALRRTNQRCQNLFRGLPAAAHYQGPQCFAERQNAAKLTFDPNQVPQQSNSHRAIQSS